MPRVVVHTPNPALPLVPILLAVVIDDFLHPDLLHGYSPRRVGITSTPWWVPPVLR